MHAHSTQERRSNSILKMTVVIAFLLLPRTRYACVCSIRPVRKAVSLLYWKENYIKIINHFRAGPTIYQNLDTLK